MKLWGINFWQFVLPAFVIPALAFTGFVAFRQFVLPQFVPQPIALRTVSLRTIEPRQLTPARDLTGRWTGNAQYSFLLDGDDRICSKKYDVILDINNQNGNAFGGNITQNWLSSDVILQCVQDPPSNNPVNGTISGSRIELNAAGKIYKGSITSDTMTLNESAARVGNGLTITQDGPINLLKQ